MKNINSKIFASFMAVVLLVLSSCASTPKGKVTKCEPVGNDSTLLVGRVVASIKNVESFMGVTNLNGYNKKGVKVTIRENETKKKYEIYADKNGMFYLKKAKVGNHYEIVEVEVKSESSGAAQWITFPINYNRKTVCNVNQANIIADLIIEKDGNDGDRFNWRDPGLPDEVKFHFIQSYPDSEWNKYQFTYNFVQ